MSLFNGHYHTISTGIPKRQFLPTPGHPIPPAHNPKREHKSKGQASLNRLLHLFDVQFNVRVHLQELVVCTVDFVLDFLFQVRHLEIVT